MKAALLTKYYQHPTYVLGGTAVDETDCSKLYGEAAFEAGIPGVNKRPTAYSICTGKDGYPNKIVRNWATGDQEDCDFICQHWDKSEGGLTRPDGINHIIAVIEFKGLWHIIHASSSAGTVVLRPFKNWVESHMIKNGYRRLTIGDPKPKEKK